MYMTGFASLIKHISQDPGLLLLVIYFLICLLHFMLFIVLLGLHQKYGIGFTLVRYPMSLLFVPSMFSAKCVI